MSGGTFYRRADLLRDTAKRDEMKRRQQGYDDGFALRPAASREVVYAQAWRRGREARQQEDA